MEFPQCGVRSAERGVSTTEVRNVVARRRRFIRVIKIAGLIFTNESQCSALHPPQTSATSIT